MHLTEKDKQLITKLLQPYCCHVSGMHNPSHFEDDPRDLCNLQKARVFDHLCELVEHEPVAISDPDCGWCKRHAEELAKYAGKNKIDDLGLLDKTIKSGIRWLYNKKLKQPKYSGISHHGFSASNRFGYLKVTLAPRVFAGQPVFVFALPEYLPKSKLNFDPVFKRNDIATIRKVVSKYATIESTWNGIGSTSFSIGLKKPAVPQVLNLVENDSCQGAILPDYFKD